MGTSKLQGMYDEMLERLGSSTDFTLLLRLVDVWTHLGSHTGHLSFGSCAVAVRISLFRSVFVDITVLMLR